MNKGPSKFILPHGTHKIRYQTTTPILLSVNEQPVRALNTGSGSFTLRNFEGTLSVDPSEPKQPYGLEIKTREFVKGEEFDEAPVPQPAQSPNWLTQMRERVKMSMGIIREEFAEQGRTMYEVTDDEAEELRQSVLSADEPETATTQEPEASDPPTTPSDQGKASD